MRVYTKLNCGCYVSCDGGGGLIPCEHHLEHEPDGELKEYLDKHKMLNGYCSICHKDEWKNEALKIKSDI